MPGSLCALHQEAIGLGTQLLRVLTCAAYTHPTTTTANVVATTSSSRTRRLMASDRVPDAADRVDESGRAVDLGLAAQVPDVDVERLRRRLEVVAPDAFVDGVAGDDDARVEHQQLEQIELGLGQLELAPGAPRLAPFRVEHEIGDGQCLVALGDTAAPQQGAHPGEELVERERLDEVVVGAGVEPGDAVGDLVASGQHQHRRVIAAVAQDPAHREPVGTRA